MAIMEGGSELPLSCLEVDDSLEGRLQAHGLSRRNVKSMIYSIFSDENVMKLLEGGDETMKLDITYAPVTRSKKQNGIPDDSFEYDFSEHVDCSAADVRSSNVSSVANENINSSSVYSSTVKHTAFNVNDDDAYIDENGDFDWKNWLDDIQDEEVTISNTATNENSDSDPDYHFLEEFEERDEEDYRYDRTTKISQKELKSLHRKRRRHHQSIGSKLCMPNAPAGMQLDGKRKRQTIETFLKCPTARDKLALLRCTPNLPIPSKRRKTEMKIEYLSFTNKQMNELKQQMQQHVQLLAQSYLLDIMGETNVSSLLREIGYFKTTSHNPMLSLFNVANIDEAIELTNSEPRSMAHETQNSGNDKGSLIASCVANSRVFMYRELLPKTLDFPQIPRKARFSYHEDCLIAHGCYEMSSHRASSVELTQQYLLPNRSTTEIRNRIKGVMHGRLKNCASNPIFKIQTLGILPEPCKLVKPVVPDTMMRPFDMCSGLPKWLVDFKSITRCTESHDLKVACSSVSCKKSAKNLGISHLGKVCVLWTKEMDKTILHEVQRTGGLTEKALSAIHTSFPARSHKQIEQRFQKLMKIYSKIHTDGS